MFWLDNPSGVPQKPAEKPVHSTTRLYFTEGGSGQAPSYPGEEWFNMVTDELLNVVSEAGLQPDKADRTLLAKAIKKIITNASATETISGTMRFANAAEAAPTSLAVASDSLGLSVKQAFTLLRAALANASKTTRGTARFCTSAELISGVLSDVCVSPETLKTGLSEQLTETGYRVPPPWLSGLIEQWGVTSVIGDGVTATVTLPIPFPTMGLNGVATVVTVAGSGASTEVSVIDFPTASTMRIAFNSTSGASSTVRYRAWGK